MTASTDVAPIIIKKKKVSGGDGHHGGAWKVAYADFVTAMMAFFMLMWLLNATSEQQRSGIAHYFSPTIAISNSSGGGDGAQHGDSIMTDETLPKSGKSAALTHPADAKLESMAKSGEDQEAEDQKFKELEETLMGMGGESMIEENALKHIVTEVTDEGLVFEIHDLPNMPLFVADSAEPTPVLKAIARMIQDVAKLVSNQVAVGGHVNAEPIVISQSTVWGLSSDRADVMRQLLEGQGLPARRLQRVTGFADREPAVPNPMAPRNNRLEIVMLRR